MDFAEAEYISRVRSGVKGHFSYREVAWEMKLKMEQLEPELGRLMQPPRRGSRTCSTADPLFALYEPYQILPGSYHMEITKLSTKGQVILPKTVRDAYGWNPGT
jgi:hypothetical protein